MLLLGGFDVSAWPSLSINQGLCVILHLTAFKQLMHFLFIYALINVYNLCIRTYICMNIDLCTHILIMYLCERMNSKWFCTVTMNSFKKKFFVFDVDIKNIHSHLLFLSSEQKLKLYS